MRIKIFEFSKPFFSWTWKIIPANVESQVSAWLNEHPDVQIESIHHTSFASFWYPPQLLVTVYYR